MGYTGEDWAAVLSRFLEGDRIAFLKLSRLVTGFLSRWRAFDFHDDWEDLVQEVLAGVVVAVREKRLTNPSAIVSYLRSTAQHKFCDRLRRHVRCKEDETLPWDEIQEQDIWRERPVSDEETATEVRRRLAELPDSQGEMLFLVYGCGRTYEQAAEDVGVPLGTFKRRLRQGLAQLRAGIEDGSEIF